jgi:hypothetical protein
MRNKKIITTTIVVMLAGGLLFMYAQNAKRLTAATNASPQDQVVNDLEVEKPGVPTGDDPWKEMDKLISSYYNEKGVMFKGTLKVIDDNEETEKIIENHNFEYASLNGEFYYSITGIEVVRKRDLVLVADHANKVVAISNAIEPAGRKNSFFDISEFKKIMEETKAVAEVTQEGDKKILTIDNIADPMIQGYRIYYDPVTYRIEKMLIGMVRLYSVGNETANVTAEEEVEEEGLETFTYYMEILYKEANVLELKNGGFRPEAKFIHKTGNTMQLTSAFKSYQLVNSGDSEPEEMNDNDED